MSFSYGGKDMQIEIKGKKYNCIFGVKFIRELDKQHGVVRNDVNLGMGLTTLLPQLVSGNIVVLSDVLYTATITEKSRPSKDEVDEFVETVDDIEALFDETLKNLEESNAGKLTVRNFKKALMENK
ncbi:phage protein [Enterococcus faecalis Merz96]|nr:phage protein [Enterococcus faecalis Merz96]EEU76022.1 phage protein [Enterococcus faecalis E1Sol]